MRLPGRPNSVAANRWTGLLASHAAGSSPAPVTPASARHGDGCGRCKCIAALSRHYRSYAVSL